MCSNATTVFATPIAIMNGGGNVVGMLNQAGHSYPYTLLGEAHPEPQDVVIRTRGWPTEAPRILLYPEQRFLRFGPWPQDTTDWKKVSDKEIGVALLLEQRLTCLDFSALRQAAKKEDDWRLGIRFGDPLYRQR